MLRILALVVSVVFATAGCGRAPARELVGYTLEPSPHVGDLSLPAAGNGEEFELRSDSGELLLVFFGFTHCPDICPMTMSDIRAALDDLADSDQELVDVAMVTVDPERDTDNLLDGFVTSFVDDAVGLRTLDEARLFEVADRFGVSYMVTHHDDGRVEVAHTGSVFVVDEHGDVRLVWTFGTGPDGMTNDLEILLDGFP